MAPTRDPQVTLDDLLDRVLERGLVLDADLVIHVAGIPLLGVKLRAALAGMETMIRDGLWEHWDEALRQAAAADRVAEKAPSGSNEDGSLGANRKGRTTHPTEISEGPKQRREEDRYDT